MRFSSMSVLGTLRLISKDASRKLTCRAENAGTLALLKFLYCSQECVASYCQFRSHTGRVNLPFLRIRYSVR